jgi:hypothetical protein
VVSACFLILPVTSVIETPGNRRSHRSIAKIAGIKSQNFSPQIYADERRLKLTNTNQNEIAGDERERCYTGPAKDFTTAGSIALRSDTTARKAAIELQERQCRDAKAMSQSRSTHFFRAKTACLRKFQIGKKLANKGHSTKKTFSESLLV